MHELQSLFGVCSILLSQEDCSLANVSLAYFVSHQSALWQGTSHSVFPHDIFLEELQKLSILQKKKEKRTQWSCFLLENTAAFIQKV